MAYLFRLTDGNLIITVSASLDAARQYVKEKNLDAYFLGTVCSGEVLEVGIDDNSLEITNL